MKKSIHNPIVLIRLIRPIIHAFIIGSIFVAGLEIRKITDLIPGIQLRIPPIVTSELIIFATISIIIFIVYGITQGFYELFKPTSNVGKTHNIMFFNRFVMITFIAFFGDGFIFIGGISRFIIIWVAILSYFAIKIIDWTITIAIRYFQKRNQTTILVGFKSNSDISSIKEKIEFEKNINFEYIEIETVNDIDNYDFDGFIAVGNFEKGVLQEIFDKIRLHGKQFFHIADSIFMDDIVYQAERFGTTFAFEYKPSRLDGRSIVVKRLFDIIVSLAGIIILSPILVLTAILIIIQDGRPVIYFSQRTGKNMKPFRMLKFRSMVKNAEKLKPALQSQNEREGPLFKIADDPRVTPLGKILRKTSIDELPQLFNVLIGEMSIIGPRPHLPSEIEKYEPRQKRLLSSKPGITGYAQIFGRDDLSFDKEASLDLWYIQNRSLWLDLYIIIKTFFVLLKGR